MPERNIVKCRHCDHRTRSRVQGSRLAITRLMPLAATLLVLASVVLVGCGTSRHGVENYYPLGRGLVWSYQSATSGTITLTNLAPRDLAGRRVVPQTFQNPWMGNLMLFVFADTNGASALAVQTPAEAGPRVLRNPACFLKYPAKPGLNWFCPALDDPDQQGSYMIEAVDDVVTVPAGTFKSCVRVRCDYSVSHPWIGTTLKEERKWYAPGVGMVKWMTTEHLPGEEFFGPSGMTTTLELVSYKK